MGSAGNSKTVPREVLGFWSIQGMLLVAANYGWINRGVWGPGQICTRLWYGCNPGLALDDPRLAWGSRSVYPGQTQVYQVFSQNWAALNPKPTSLRQATRNLLDQPHSLRVLGTDVQQLETAVVLSRRKILFTWEMRWGFVIIMAGISESPL